VKQGDDVFSSPGGAEGLALVPAGMEDAVTEASEECPGECIFIEQS
jgi:ferredoxin